MEAEPAAPSSGGGKFDDRSPDEQLAAGQDVKPGDEGPADNGDVAVPGGPEGDEPAAKRAIPDGAPATNPFKHPVQNGVDVPGGDAEAAKNAKSAGVVFTVPDQDEPAESGEDVQTVDSGSDNVPPGGNKPEDADQPQVTCVCTVGV